VKTEKSKNPQSSEMADISNNSIFSESMENPTTLEVQPIADIATTLNPNQNDPPPSSARATSKITVRHTSV
jgi:hypothetical protein